MAPVDRVIRLPSSLWGRLPGNGLTADALTARCALPEVSERLLAAVDREGRRHLLVALTASEVGYADCKSRGIEISTRDLVVAEGAQGRYLDLRCLDPLGFDVFDALGGELAATLAAELEEPAVAAQRLLGRWRRFWLTPPGPLLSREERIGLFAELWFLAYWLVPKIGMVHATDAWRGPLGARHDFELSDRSIEVKATTSGAGRSHRVHGIDQLGVPDGGTLLVFSLELREEGGGANTLPGIIEHIRDLATEDDEVIVRFETKLAQTGYAAAIGSDAEDMRFRIIDERLYRVEGSFPRLIRDSLIGGVPDGVNDVAYTISLSGFDAYIVATRPEQFGTS